MAKMEKQDPVPDRAGFPPAAPKTATGMWTSVRKRPFDSTLDEHHEIRHAIQEITDHLSRYRVGLEEKAWRDWMSGFSGMLKALHERLREHFEEEEQSGLYEALSEKLPNVVPRTRVVREEHTTILKELAGILASLDVLQPTFPLEPRLLDGTREVLYRIVRHERKESDLIARAYLEELGEHS